MQEIFRAEISRLFPCGAARSVLSASFRSAPGNPDGVKPAQLADKVNIQRQLVTIILRDFESRGLILRKEQKADHRRKRILPSKQGVLFANEVCEASDTLDLHGLAAFTPAEQEKLLEYSRRFYNAIRNGPDKEIRSIEKRA